ncbi:tyrosine-type recombinase/integrase [Butyrivibrio sp. AE3004]|uniref:tyrosine-type recombinase/integrase n=1 Tax=Butyrivibrio sp. AE3004 TaxID=1506994 RepID=UPI0004945838|nr:site-specific integrase [Butyrivibrio sp. AE3004]
MSKRKNGEGSYGKRKINGTTYQYYRFPDGHFVYGKTAAIRDEKIKEYKQELAEKPENILTDNPLLTFGEFARIWLSGRTNELVGTTYGSYHNCIENRMYDFKDYDIANVQLTSLTPKMFEDYLFALAKVYSKATVDKSWTVLKQVLKEAMKRELMPRLAIEDIKIPKEKDVKVKQKEVPFITPQDMERLYKEYTDKEYPMSGNIIIFIMYSGCRVSEVIASKWGQVSEDFTSIKIDRAQSKALKRDEKGDIIINDNNKIQFVKDIKDPKSESGKRNIPLPKRAQKILKELYMKYPHEPDDLIFPAPSGGVYDRVTINKTLIRMEKRAGCTQYYTPHCLRHGYGSYLLSRGVDIKIVSELLGHKDVTTTYNIYIGILKEDKINAVLNAFDEPDDSDN